MCYHSMNIAAVMYHVLNNILTSNQIGCAVKCRKLLKLKENTRQNRLNRNVIHVCVCVCVCVFCLFCFFCFVFRKMIMRTKEEKGFVGFVGVDIRQFPVKISS
jgi:hypothetical protein